MRRRKGVGIPGKVRVLLELDYERLLEDFERILIAEPHSICGQW